MAEAWVASFKAELVDGRRFPSFEHAGHETLHWIKLLQQRAARISVIAARRV